jgi:hypothetical protein
LVLWGQEIQFDQRVHTLEVDEEPWVFDRLLGQWECWLASFLEMCDWEVSLHYVAQTQSLCLKWHLGVHTAEMALSRIVLVGWHDTRLVERWAVGEVWLLGPEEETLSVWTNVMQLPVLSQLEEVAGQQRARVVEQQKRAEMQAL